MKRWVVGVVLLFLSAGAVEAKTVALSGVPEVQTKSSFEETERIEVDSAKKKGLRLVVVKEGEEYFWETRERKKLIRRMQGAFTLFIDPTGGGYIKVAPLADGKMIYLEHLSKGLETFTYWGVVEHFEP